MTLIPRYESAPDNTPDKLVVGDYLRDMSEIITRFADLIESLPTHAPPIRQSVQYEFFPRNDLENAYPQLVKDRLLTRDLQIIRVTSVKEMDIPADTENGIEPEACSPTTTIEFIDEDGTIYISRDPDIKDGTNPDILLDRNDRKHIEIGRIPDDEISNFLLRLASKPVDEPLSEEDAFKQRIEASDVIENLNKNAITASFDFDFETPSGRVLTLTFEQAGNYRQLASCIIYYETGSNRQLSVEIDQSNGFSLRFQTSDGTGMFSPDDGDIVRLNEILGEELRWVKSLSQNGLDTPNTSA